MKCLLISSYLLFLIKPRVRAKCCLCRSVLSRTQKAWLMVIGFESGQVSHIHVSRGNHLSDEPLWALKALAESLPRLALSNILANSYH